MTTSDDQHGVLAADAHHMASAIDAAWSSRTLAPPNPWVGAVLVSEDGSHTFSGSTRRPGSNHAEREVLDAAGELATGSTVYTTLEPCNHTGRTGPCTQALIDAGVRRVVIAVLDPDPLVAGAGQAALEAAGVDVVLGVGAAEVAAQLAPYLHHRRTGRPWVVLKLAATLDGRTAAADGTSQWITGDAARLDAHQVRAESDAILVGAGTVRLDDPSLTVRGVLASDGQPPREPLRVVLGRADPDAKIHPCREMSGDLDVVLDDLGTDQIVQLMIEGGAAVAGEFWRRGLVDHVVLYLAPALMGGDDGAPLFRGAGAAGIADLSRGHIERIAQLGDDLRIDMRPDRPSTEVLNSESPNTESPNENESGTP